MINYWIDKLGFVVDYGDYMSIVNIEASDEEQERKVNEILKFVNPGQRRFFVKGSECYWEIVHDSEIAILFLQEPISLEDFENAKV